MKCSSQVQNDKLYLPRGAFCRRAKLSVIYTTDPFCLSVSRSFEIPLVLGRRHQRDELAI